MYDASGVGAPGSQVTATLSPDGTGLTSGAILNSYLNQTTGAPLPVTPEAAVGAQSAPSSSAFTSMAPSYNYIPSDPSAGWDSTGP
jgi:hypothetical protein